MDGCGTFPVSRIRGCGNGAGGARKRARAWLDPLLAPHEGNAPFRLAVGGPRQSEARGIYRKARAVFGEFMKTA